MPLKFKPEDFVDHMDSPIELASVAQAKFDEWVEKQRKENISIWEPTKDGLYEDYVSARIFDIEEKK